MPRKGAQAKAFAAQQAKKREAEKQEARAKVDAEKNNAKGISECRDVGQLMRMHRANSERIEHMEEAQEKDAKRKEAERAAKEKELEESQGKSWWDKFLPKPKGPREATSPNKVQQQRDNIEQFYDLLKCSKHVKREIQAVFKAFDANKDGSLNINEFRTYLKEPKERMPFLNRIFLTMDNDAMDGAERVNTYGVGELDMFEFFVGYYSICSLPRGDYAIRFIWDLYDPRRTGEIDSETFRCMIREGMSAMLPDYLLRGDEPLPPAVTEQLEKIRKEQGEELWTKLRYGDVAVRTDGNGERHLAIVKDHTDYSVTVQDIYSLENAMGWTQSDDNTFTYHMNRHIVHERVAPPLPGDDLFDEALEKFMFLSADNDGDGSITLKEFRHFIRRRVACGEPSPYAAFLAFQKKLRSVGGLGDSFWDARTLDLAVTLEKHGLWSAWELHRHFNLGKICKRPPPKMGGEPPLLPPEKGKNDGPVDTSHAVWKPTSAGSVERYAIEQASRRWRRNI